MKALKEFDYNLWTTEENGVKKYFVGVKATGEVTEVDAEVMKVLRNEEKKMRRHIEEEGELGAPLSLDSAVGDENNSTWMTDTYNLAEDVQTEIMEVNSFALCHLCKKPCIDIALRVTVVLRISPPSRVYPSRQFPIHSEKSEKKQKYFLHDGLLLPEKCPLSSERQNLSENFDN